MSSVIPHREGVVPFGPRDYRRRIRRRGPVVAVLPAVGAGALALVLLWGNTGASRGVGAVALALFAAPLLLAVGAPLTTGTIMLAAVVASVVLWVALGGVAAHRCTRRPAADWRDFWFEYLWLAGGIWIGVVAALVVANLVLGNALF